MKLAIGTTLTAFLALSAVLPGPAFGGNVTVKGSDTMVILGQRWAEDFMKKNPETSIQVTGGGSGTGISALINGTTDICMASREMKPAEKEKLRDRYATTGVEIAVARDGLSIYVHTTNPVASLTLDQLKAIYSGKVTNWKEVGGADAKIVLYSRENSSGTYVFFKDEVLKGADFSPRAQTLPGTAAVVNAVAKEKNGIGYGGAAYAKNLKVVPVAKTASDKAITPDLASVRSGEYALARPLFFYVRNKPSGELATFVDWVLGSEGQALAEKVGYYPVK
jgi:phosphate transport system substrate-binding protein